MANETGTQFAHIREVPWHGVGIEVEGRMTAAQAITAAKLDWTVDKEQVTRNGVAVPNTFWQIRSDTNEILGGNATVSGAFQSLQNRDAFTFADNLVDSGEGLWESAGSLRKGRQVFMSMKLPQGLTVAGTDAHELYLILRNGHDGSKAVTVDITPIRLACTNMLKLSHTKAVQSWSIRHTNTMEGKLAQAREALKLTYTYAEEFAELGTTLADTKITDDEFTKIMQDVFPHRPATDEKIEHVLHLFHDSPTIEGFHGTAWGALNAFTEYTDHGRDSKSREGAFHVLMNGELATQRDKLTDQLLAHV